MQRPATCRIADNYRNYKPRSRLLQPMNQFIPASRSVRAGMLGQIPFVINFIGSWSWGKRRRRSNPWEATTLEWNDAPSPPPHLNFAKTPVVHHGPYEYSSPLVDEDWLPQAKRFMWRVTSSSACGRPRGI